MKTTGCLLVSWDFSHGKDKVILLVGEKNKGESVDIINAFQGNDAIELYEKLITKKEVKNNG